MNTVYLMSGEVDGEIQYKIGFTKYENPDKRYKQLKTGNPTLEIVNFFNTEYNRKIETYLHNKFSYCRGSGEWFKLDDDDVLGFSSLCQKLEIMYDSLKNSNNPYI